MNENKKIMTVIFDHRPETLQKNDKNLNSCNLNAKKFKIIYVKSKIQIEDVQVVNAKLQLELPVEFNRVENIQEIFSLLSNPFKQIDGITLDIEDLYKINGSSVFDIIRTLHTLIQCTDYRPTNNCSIYNKPQKRNTRISAIVAVGVSKVLLKEILSMPEITDLSLRYDGQRVDYTVLKRGIENHISTNCERTPKFMMDLLKDPKRKKTKSDEIKLTARQHQVFNIIITRGISNKHIAKMLNISESTVKLHVGSIFKKYGVKNRTQLAVFSNKKKSQSEVHT